MNILSGQCIGSQLTTTGEVYLNGYLTTAMQRTTNGLIGYVEQHEIFVDTMTLEEHLIFQVLFSFISGE
jgi:ABC-type multidrug transport system ATPase subunit